MIEAGEGKGLESHCLAVLRRDRAWSGPLVLPGAVRELAGRSELVILIGPPGLGRDLEPPALIRAPGVDPVTLREVVRRAFALN